MFQCEIAQLQGIGYWARVKQHENLFNCLIKFVNVNQSI